MNVVQHFRHDRLKLWKINIDVVGEPQKKSQLYKVGYLFD